ncbi:hypothetical protein GQ457_18G024140 [Hibiscus cannabinus]
MRMSLNERLNTDGAAVPVVCVCSVLEAELWGVTEGLRLAWDVGTRVVLLEVDNDDVVQIVHDKAWVSSLHRSANMVLDGMAKFARSSYVSSLLDERFATRVFSMPHDEKPRFTPPLSFFLSRAIFVDMAKSSFKLEHPLERRQAEAARIREKYPDRIPVIVERAEKSDVPEIDKKKYLVPADLTVGQFVYVVRKRIKLSPEKAIFIFVKNILPPTAAMLSAIYEENKDEDGFLYMTYSGENTFGIIDQGISV